MEVHSIYLGEKGIINKGFYSSLYNVLYIRFYFSLDYFCIIC